MSRTRGKTKGSVEEEEEEVVVDDGDNEIPDDEGESDAARDVKNQNEEDNFVESGPKMVKSGPKIVESGRKIVEMGLNLHYDESSTL